MSTASLLVLSVLAAPTTADEPAAQRDDIVVTGQREEDGYGSNDQRSATRLSLSPKETPQSVSVVTRAQIDDFRLTDVNTLLQRTTGINVEQSETDRALYTARGFDVTNFQFDGIGLPFAFGIQNGAIDTAFFERVEVVRGAAGLLTSVGNPSATINFVRKRPGREFAASASLLYGSFDQLRGDVDVSAPLTADGSVRTRLVGAYQDADSYLDRYEGKRSVLYGVVEADLGPATVLAAGYGRTENRTDGGMWGALPLLYTDGSRIDLPRPASAGQPWSQWNNTDQQIFGDLTHGFGGGWTAKLTVLRRAIDADDRLYYIFGNPDRTTGAGVFDYAGAFRGPTRELVLDAYLTGPVELGGRTHEVVVGINRGTSRRRESAAYPLTPSAAVDFGAVLAGAIPEPDFLPYQQLQDYRSRRETAYGVARLDVADGVKAMVGGNLTHIRGEGESYATPRNYERTRFLPFVGTTVDLTPEIALYASYATIFNPQFEADRDNVILPPVEGDTLEAGVKGAWFGGRLNASAAIFRTRQDNSAVALDFDPVQNRTPYDTIDAKSEGIELDVGGEAAPGLNVTAGMTFLRVVDEDGDAARVFVPRRTGRLNVSYASPALPEVKVGAALQYQSRIATTSTFPARFVQGSYALVDLFARYDFTPNWSAAVNLRNVTDAKYVASLSSGQGLSGAPRTATVTVGWRF